MGNSSLATDRRDACPTERDSTAEIDASCRWPVLLLLLGAAAWLVAGTVLGLIASIKLHAPGFLADSAWLTVGRVRPAAMNALLYGFASQAGLGVALWMMSRLGGLRLLFPLPILLCGIFWNIGVALGVVGILAGDTTGFEWLEMPAYAAGILFAAYVLIAICGLLNFVYRRECTLYVSQWYLFAALFCFPWIYSVAGYLLVCEPVRGVMQVAVNAWFTGNFLNLWLTPLGLAVVFYFVPKLTGRPLHNYWLAVFGFWTLLVFAGWCGLAQLVGGPLPGWMINTSIAANLMLLVPILAVALNWHHTLQGAYGRAKTDFVLRFVLAAGACYVLAGIVGVVIGFKNVSAITQLTLVPAARTNLALHGFVGLALFGAIYHILPRVMQVEWPSAKLIRLHFLASVVGVALLFLAPAVGGVIQGVKLSNPAADFVAVSRATIPFIGNASLGLFVLLVGQAAFAWNTILLLRRYCEKSCSVCDWLQVGQASRLAPPRETIASQRTGETPALLRSADPAGEGGKA